MIKEFLSYSVWHQAENDEVTSKSSEIYDFAQDMHSAPSEQHSSSTAASASFHPPELGVYSTAPVQRHRVPSEYDCLPSTRWELLF